MGPEKEQAPAQEQEQEQKQEEAPEKEEQAPEQEEQQEEESSEEQEEQAPEDESAKPITKADLDNVLKSFNDKLESLRQPAQPAPKSEGPKEAEWTLEKVRDVERRINEGELPETYRSWVEEKKIELISSAAALKERQAAEFNYSWNASMEKAVGEFPELKDPTSELFKLAAHYVKEDPGYKKYIQLKTRGSKDIDMDVLDPDLQYKCAQRAFGVLARKGSFKPKPSSKEAAKSALEGKTDIKHQVSELDRLEKAAVESGDPQAWTRFFTAREKHLKTAGKK